VFLSVIDADCGVGLEETALVVLLAVLAVVEGLHHLAVLLGHKLAGHLCHALANSSIGDQSSNLTGDPLHALLGLHEGHVHVLQPLDHVTGGGVI